VRVEPSPRNTMETRAGIYHQDIGLDQAVKVNIREASVPSYRTRLSVSLALVTNSDCDLEQF